MVKKHRFIFALAIQIAVILGILLYYMLILTNGTTIVLDIRPVDPRDPLRGDYVTFQYDISTQWRNKFFAEPVEGQTVYVPLRKSSGVWVVDWRSIETTPFTEQIAIKGTIVKTPHNDDSSEVHIKYGIEEYFIPEGTGQNFPFWEHDAKAVVTVDEEGNPVLRKVIVDGREFP